MKLFNILLLFVSSSLVLQAQTKKASPLPAGYLFNVYSDSHGIPRATLAKMTSNGVDRNVKIAAGDYHMDNDHETLELSINKQNAINGLVTDVLKGSGENRAIYNVKDGVVLSSTIIREDRLASQSRFKDHVLQINYYYPSQIIQRCEVIDCKIPGPDNGIILRYNKSGQLMSLLDDIHKVTKAYKDTTSVTGQKSLAAIPKTNKPAAIKEMDDNPFATAIRQKNPIVYK